MDFEERIEKKQKLKTTGLWWLFQSGLLASLIFIPSWAAGIIGATACFLYCMAHKKVSEQVEIKPYDNKMAAAETLNPSSIWDGTYLGHYVPFHYWRSYLRSYQKNDKSPNSRRAAAQAIFPDMKPFILDDDWQKRHVAVQASTGLLKTELVKAIAYQQIKKGGGAIMVEAKSDSNFSGTVYQLCKECDCLDRLQLINIERPEISHTWNPILEGGLRQQLSTMMKIQSKSSEEFWTDITRYSMSAAILAMMLQPGAPAYNLKDLVALLSDFSVFKKMVRNIRESDSEDHRNGKNYLTIYIRFWVNENDLKVDVNRYKTLVAGEISKLSAYCLGEYGKVLNSYAPDVRIKEAILEGKIVLLSMSALADQDGTDLLGRLFIADVSRAIGEIQLDDAKPIIPCPVILDEYGSYKDPSHIAMFQLARSANVPIWVLMQGKGFLEDSGDKVFAEKVMGNCWTHIYGDVRDTITRDFAINMGGELLEKLKQESSGENIGSSLSSESTGIITQDNEGQSHSSGYKEGKDTVIQASDFSDLEEGDAIVITKTGVLKVRTPILKLATKPVKWNDMRLVKHPQRGRPGLELFDQLAEKSKIYLEG